MGLFSGQLANVVQWDEDREDVIFYKWNNAEIKRGSRLIIRPGQDAVFLHNGRTEGIFREEGSYDIESDIVPFLSSLRGFKFGFNSGIRAEVLFVNTKEFQMKWGTKQAINIPNPALPGGMPIRANGSFQFKVDNYETLIDKVAGVKNQFTTGEVRERVLALLDPLLLKWIMQEGKDLFHIQANAIQISNGIMEDLNQEIKKIGLLVTGFQIHSVSYPEEVQRMVTKAAGQTMVGDMQRYQQMAMTDALSNPGGSGGSIAADMASMQMGMMMGRQMTGQMQEFGEQSGSGRKDASPQSPEASGQEGKALNFCPNCGSKTNGMKFCGNCGYKLV